MGRESEQAGHSSVVAYSALRLDVLERESIRRTGNRIDVVQLRSRRVDTCYSSMASTHNEQSHVVAWRTSLAETGDIPQNTVSLGFRSLVTMIRKCTNQAIFFVFIALRILRLRDTVGI